MPVRRKFTSRLSTSWSEKKSRDLDTVALTMATDVDRGAKVLAPVDKGNLVNSAEIEKLAPGHYEVSFGGSNGKGVNVKYARKRHYENFKNPQTVGYLERAGEAVAEQKKKYLGKNI